MRGFKRFIFIVYFLLSVVGVGYLFCAWFDYQPVLERLAPYASQPWFRWTVIGCVCVCMIGVLVVFLRALFTPSDRKYLHVHTEFGNYDIERKAISSVVRTTAAMHGDIEYLGARIKIRRRGPSIGIKATLAPEKANVSAELYRRIQGEIKAAVENFTGVDVTDVVLILKRTSDAAQSTSATMSGTEAATGSATAQAASSATADSQTTSATAGHATSAAGGGTSSATTYADTPRNAAPSVVDEAGNHEADITAAMDTLKGGE